MNRSGIVMTVEEKFAVVLTKDGQFCRVPRSAAMSVGMEVSWQVDAFDAKQGFQEKSKRRIGTRRWVAWQRYGVAGLVATLMVSIGAWVTVNTLAPAQAEAYAYVSVDINPSFSFEIDKQLMVLSAIPLNADAQALLASLNLKGKSLSSAMQQVIQGAAARHMIPSEDGILVATAPVHSADQMAQVQVEVEQDIHEAIAANALVQSLHPSVYSLGLSNALWQAADKANLPPGKLAVYLVARDEGEDVSLQQLNGGVLKTVLANSNENAVKALASENVDVIEQFISQMKQSGLLNNALRQGNLAGVSGGATSNVLRGWPENAGKSDSQEVKTNRQPSTVTVQLGNTEFSVQLDDAEHGLAGGTGEDQASHFSAGTSVQASHSSGTASSPTGSDSATVKPPFRNVEGGQGGDRNHGASAELNQVLGMIGGALRQGAANSHSSSTGASTGWDHLENNNRTSAGSGTTARNSVNWAGTSGTKWKPGNEGNSASTGEIPNGNVFGNAFKSDKSSDGDSESHSH